MITIARAEDIARRARESVRQLRQVGVTCPHCLERFKASARKWSKIARDMRAQDQAAQSAVA